MKIKTARINIAGIDLEVEPASADFKEQMLAVTNLIPRKYCGVCENSDPSKFRVFVRKNGEYIFLKNVCYGDAGQCKAVSELGQHKDSKEGFFWKPFARWENNTVETSKKEQPEQDVIREEDIPF